MAWQVAALVTTTVYEPLAVAVKVLVAEAAPRLVVPLKN